MIRPIEDRVVVRELESDLQSPGGLYIPESAADRPQTGEVIAVGPGKRTKNGRRVRPELEVGDRIVYRRVGGTEVDLDGEHYVVLRESDVLVVTHRASGAG
jgi:chaperonin GroES